MSFAPGRLLAPLVGPVSAVVLSLLLILPGCGSQAGAAEYDRRGWELVRGKGRGGHAGLCRRKQGVAAMKDFNLSEWVLKHRAFTGFLMVLVLLGGTVASF